MSSQMFFQQLVNGISLGSLYALIAIGYTMIYGILRLINFAHGDIFMMAIYFAFFGILTFGIPPYVCFALVIVLTGLLGMTVEAIAYKPIREAPKITILISAIGVSFFLENLATVIFGGRPRAFPEIAFFARNLNFLGVYIQSLTFMIPVITGILLFLMLYLINHTKSGMAMRAISKDQETAKLMGVNVNRIVSITFGIGSILAGVAGIMWGLKYPSILPLMGVMPGLKAFTAAVIGGIGNIKGAVMGGFLLGIAEIMLVAFFPTLTGYRDALAFILLLLVLLFKPTGLMGEAITEKM